MGIISTILIIIIVYLIYKAWDFWFNGGWERAFVSNIEGTAKTIFGGIFGTQRAINDDS
jgi:ABC-type multidrug transport system permease subunit